jgi:hypothetical protein
MWYKVQFADFLKTTLGVLQHFFWSFFRTGKYLTLSLMVKRFSELLSCLSACWQHHYQTIFFLIHRKMTTAANLEGTCHINGKLSHVLPSLGKNSSLEFKSGLRYFHFFSVLGNLNFPLVCNQYVFLTSGEKTLLYCICSFFWFKYVYRKECIL